MRPGDAPISEECHKPELLWPSSCRAEFSNVPPAIEQAFQRDFPQLEIVVARGAEQFEQRLAHCEVLVTYKLRLEHFSRCRKLRWIHSPMAGVTQLLFPELVSSNVILTNGRTVHAIPVADHAFALMLALARQLPNCFRFQTERRWGQLESWHTGNVPFEMDGRTLGIVGLGSIGRELAVRAHAFGMRVIATKNHPSRGAELAERTYPPGRLHELLAQSDFVVLCAPALPATHHLIGKPELACMKPQACLINVARGSLLDTDALCDALRAGRIAAAALDVTEPEPLPPDHPLWTLPNALITPHLGGASRLFWERETALLRDNLHRYISGEPLLNVVDKTRGY